MVLVTGQQVMLEYGLFQLCCDLDNLVEVGIVLCGL